MGKELLLVGELVELRTLRLEDMSTLLEIAREPEIARWWQVEGSYFEGKVGVEENLAIVYRGEVVGFSQFYEEKGSQTKHAGLDLFMTARLHRQGLGTDTIRTLIQFLIKERGHHRLVIDPHVENHAAIACYKRIGFKKVGVMRNFYHKSGHIWEEALLLDLLAEEFFY